MDVEPSGRQAAGRRSGRLSRRLAYAFIPLVVIITVFTGAAVWGMNRTKGTLEEIARAELPRSTAVSQMQVALSGQNFAVLHYVASPDPRYLITMAANERGFQDALARFRGASGGAVQGAVLDDLAPRGRQLSALRRSVVNNVDDRIRLDRLARAQRLDLLTQVEQLSSTATPQLGAERREASLLVSRFMEAAKDAQSAAVHGNAAAQAVRRRTLYYRAGSALRRADAPPRARSALNALQSASEALAARERLVDGTLADIAVLRGDMDRLLNEKLAAASTRDLYAAQRHAASVARTTMVIGLLGSLVALLVTAVTLVRLRRALVDPLQRLSIAAERAAEGDLRQVVEANRDDELGDLAESFSRMLRKRHEAETQLAEAMDDLRRLADHDALTGLPNRRKFDEALAHQIDLSTRYNTPAALLLLDLDGFKAVNDKLGHQAGDRLLRTIASVMVEQLRVTDLVARLGGDEFAVLLPETEPDQAATVAEKLRAAIEREGMVAEEAGVGRVTASIGIVRLAAEVCATSRDAVALADRALYEAKARGRNGAVMASSEEGLDQATATKTWMERLAHADEDEGFELVTMPIVRLADRAVVRYELLIRYRESDGTVIPPAAFLPIAERYGLSGVLDRAVFRRAITMLGRHPGLRVALNLSAKTLSDPDFATDIAGFLDEIDLAPGALCVEVTETAAITAPEQARANVEALAALGCEIALDDFGSGFATFTYLRHMRFDELKIDGQFISSLRTNRSDRLVVEAVVGLARGLGAHTVAEFVDNEECIAELRRLGVDFGQGFFFGRPVPVAEILLGLESGALRRAS